MLKEFKTFAVKGNMVDMAVWIIIGGAFATIIKSLVNDVLMPVISGVFKLPDFSNLFVVLNGEGTYETVAAAREAWANIFAYGLFINAIIAFLLVAIALFFVVKGINSLKKDEKKKEEKKWPTELDILQEIRDSLKK